MGEAILTSRSGGIAANNGSSAELKTVIIKETDSFIVPKARNQQFSVRIFGGGGGGSGCGYTRELFGGGGGWMNNAILTINQGDIVQVTIGKGGNGRYVPFGTNKSVYNIINNGGNGGTTSFGTYLSALGGTGGGGSYGCGGAGGAGGGGIGIRSVDYTTMQSGGGTGYQFGGGGGNHNGGNGGKWGGGGGSGSARISYIPRGGCLYENSQNIKEITGYSGLAGNGYANLGVNNYNPTNGTNTIGNSDVPESMQGPGLAGSVQYNNVLVSGGGGYGGCGGDHYGGGGGYGANGGNYGGGGGGYGGKGGDYGGGGGSYGSGGDGPSEDGITGRIPTGDGMFGGGGGGHNNNGYAGNGGDGICIIQYYST